MRGKKWFSENSVRVLNGCSLTKIGEWVRGCDSITVGNSKFGGSAEQEVTCCKSTMETPEQCPKIFQS